MNQIETLDSNNICLAEVLISDDGMTGYIKLTKLDEKPITKDQMLEALKASNIVYGIKESSIEKLAARPIFNIKIEVAKGLPPIDGEDGQITYFVKRDSEYQPEYSLEGNIDYKNLDYFQIVKKDQVLCEIIKETQGTEGMNILGCAVSAKYGKAPISPVGKNTQLIDDDTKLIATCDGVVKFARDKIDINDMLKIPSNVDQLTGNINFTGDINIDGDVCNGFSVKSEGNVIVKGVVENASIQAGGNVHISKGINGSGESGIAIGGDLRCKYIENAVIQVQGNIAADYIIDSKIVCMGNIELAGSRELVLGGELKIQGELKAKDIGSEKERVTRIEVLGKEISDIDEINKLKKEIVICNNNIQEYLEKANKLSQLIKIKDSSEISEQLNMVKKQIRMLQDQIEYKNIQKQKLENEWIMEYPGAVICKRRLYQGVRINFGEARFHFDFDNIEHCKIFWSDGEVIQGSL